MVKISSEKKLEKDIQREVCEWLQSEGFFFWRNNNVPIFGRSNDGIKRFRAMPKYTPKGLPDVFVLDNGEFYGLEIKREGGRISPEQRVMQESFKKNGAHYHFVFSLNDVKEIFRYGAGGINAM